MEAILKFIRTFIDQYNYLKIMASPTLIGAFIGVIIYLNKTDKIGLILASIVTIIGIVCGVLLANYAKRKGGTTEFIARVNASPDIDDAIRERK